VIPIDPKYPISPKRLKKLIAAFEEEHAKNQVLDLEPIIKEEERKKAKDPIAYEKEQKKLAKEMPEIISKTWNDVELIGFLKFFAYGGEIDKKFYEMTMAKAKKLWSGIFKEMKALSKAKYPGEPIIDDEEIFYTIVFYLKSFIQHESGGYLWGMLIPIDQIAPYIHRKLCDAIKEEWKKYYTLKVESKDSFDDVSEEDVDTSNNIPVIQNQAIKLWSGSEVFFLIRHISMLTGVKVGNLQGWDTKGWIHFRRIQDYESEELYGKWLKHLDKRVVPSSELNEFIELVEHYRDEKIGGYLNTAQATKKYNLNPGGATKLKRLRDKGVLTAKKIKRNFFYPAEELDKLFS